MKKKLLFSRIAALICCIAMCATFIIPLATTAADGSIVITVSTTADLLDENGEVLQSKVFNDLSAGNSVSFYVQSASKPTYSSSNGFQCKINATNEFEDYWLVTISLTAGANKNEYTVVITPTKVITVTAPTGDGFTYTALSKPASGESFGFYITPKDGYSKPTGVYAKVSETKTAITEVSTNYYVIPELTESVEIVVEGVTSNSYTVSALSGNYTVNGLAASYNHGTKAEFTINANAGYEVTSVIVNMSGETAILTAGENGSYTIPKVTGNAVVTVNTQKVNSTITYAGSDTAYTVVPGAVNAEYGSTVTFQVIPAEGYKAPEVTMTSGDNSTVLTPNGNQYTFTMPAGSVEITVKGNGKYTYSVTIPANVTAEGSVDLSKVEYGTNVTLVTNFDATYDESTIVVTVNGTPVSKNSDGKYVITVTENTVVTATAQKKTYTVTLVDGTGYTLTTTENTRVTAGETFRFKLNVAAGYTAPNVNVTGDSTLTGPDANGYYTLTVNGDVIVSATGATLETIVIPAVTAEGASIAEGTVQYGSNYKFTVNKENGYRVTSVIVNGTVLAAVNGEYTVYGVTSAPTIVVNTAKNVLTINYQGDGKHSVDISSEALNYSELANYALPTVDCNCAVHSFTGWNNNDVDALKALIVDNDATVTLTAQFAVDPTKLAGIVSLTPEAVENKNLDDGKVMVTFKAGVTVNVLNDPCVAELVTVSYGAVMTNDAAANLSDYAERIANGETRITLDNGNKVVVYSSSTSITLSEINGENIVYNLTTSEAGANGVASKACWIKVTAGNVSVVVVG